METQGPPPSAVSSTVCWSLWNPSCSSWNGNSTSPGNERVGKELTVLGSRSCSLSALSQKCSQFNLLLPLFLSLCGFFCLYQVILPKGCCSQAQKIIPGQENTLKHTHFFPHVEVCSFALHGSGQSNTLEHTSTPIFSILGASFFPLHSPVQLFSLCSCPARVPQRFEAISQLQWCL